jgi:hypothetical protein
MDDRQERFFPMKLFTEASGMTLYHNHHSDVNVPRLDPPTAIAVCSPDVTVFSTTFKNDVCGLNVGGGGIGPLHATVIDALMGVINRHVEECDYEGRIARIIIYAGSQSRDAISMFLGLRDKAHIQMACLAEKRCINFSGVLFSVTEAKSLDSPFSGKKQQKNSTEVANIQREVRTTYMTAQQHSILIFDKSGTNNLDYGGTNCFIRVPSLLGQYVMQIYDLSANPSTIKLRAPASTEHVREATDDWLQNEIQLRGRVTRVCKFDRRDVLNDEIRNVKHFMLYCDASSCPNMFEFTKEYWPKSADWHLDMVERAADSDSLIVPYRSIIALAQNVIIGALYFGRYLRIEFRYLDELFLRMVRFKLKDELEVQQLQLQRPKLLFIDINCQQLDKGDKHGEVLVKRFNLLYLVEYFGIMVEIENQSINQSIYEDELFDIEDIRLKLEDHTTADIQTVRFTR